MNNRFPKFLLILVAFVLTFVTHPALADGGNWDDGGGCDGEGLIWFLAIIGILAILLILAVYIMLICDYGKETGSWPLPNPLNWWPGFSEWLTKESREKEAEQRRKNSLL